MRMKWNLVRTLVLLLAMVFLNYSVTFAQEPQDEPVASVIVGPDGITWQPKISYNILSLSVSGPNGFNVRMDFPSGSNPFFGLRDGAGQPYPDGSYGYELTTIPQIADQVRQAIDGATEENREAVEAQLRSSGMLPDPVKQSGSFFIAGGAIVINDSDELESGEFSTASEKSVGAQSQVIANDLVVQGSTCVGMDCVNGESFGFDTFRLKENNLQIHFDDTSNSASFPANDWRIVANDSSNGGDSYLAIEDATAGRKPFRVEAGARANALYVESDGDIGIGTADPAVDAHIKTGNTPTVRLDQDGSSGFTPQAWDVAGNEANFFIRDVTNGSKLSFRIRPGAPESSIDIAGDGDIGLGTSSPQSAMHLRRTDGTAKLFIEDEQVANNKVLLHLESQGSIRTVFDDTANNQSWGFQFSSGSMKIGSGTIGGAPATNLKLDTSGNLQATSYSDFSDVNSKENFVSVNGEEVLERLAEIPIESWNFKNQDPAIRHIGPTAQDFHGAFGVGIDDRHIAPLDTNGVALVAIQELNKKVEEKDARIAQLEERLVALENSQQSVSQPAINKPFSTTSWGWIVVALVALLVIAFHTIRTKAARLQ